MKARARMVRCAAMAFMLVFLGAITSMGVAVACVWWQPKQPVFVWQDLDEREGTRYALSRRGSFGISSFSWTAVPREAILPMRVGDSEVPRGTNAAPRWSTFHDASARARHTEEGERRTDMRVGWPFRALRGWSGEVRDFSVAASWMVHDEGGTLQLPTRVYRGASGQPRFIGVRMMPMRPVWVGMVGNVVVYGGAWWLVILGPWVARRALRRRRGRCLRCGYDRAGLADEVACPECGISEHGRDPARRAGPP